MHPVPNLIAQVVLKQFSHLDYPILKEWCTSRGLPVPALHALPPTGLLAFLDDRPVAASFLYLTDSSLALIEGAISDPASSEDDRARALDAIGQALFAIARRRGCSATIAYSDHPSLIRRMVAHGFTALSGPVTTLIKKL